MKLLKKLMKLYAFVCCCIVSVKITRAVIGFIIDKRIEAQRSKKAACMDDEESQKENIFVDEFTADTAG